MGVLKYYFKENDTFGNNYSETPPKKIPFGE